MPRHRRAPRPSAQLGWLGTTVSLCAALCCGCGESEQLRAIRYAGAHTDAETYCGALSLVIDEATVAFTPRGPLGTWIGHCEADHEDGRRYLLCSQPEPRGPVNCVPLDGRPLGVARP